MTLKHSHVTDMAIYFATRDSFRSTEGHQRALPKPIDISTAAEALPLFKVIDKRSQQTST